jgi:hypothetical protein
MTVTTSPTKPTTATPAPPRSGRGLLLGGALGMAAGITITVAVVSLPLSGTPPTPATAPVTATPSSTDCVTLPDRADAAERFAANARLRDRNVRFC